MTLQFDFDWPEQLASMKTRFNGYTWGKPLHPANARVFGICSLTFRWPSCLAEIESAIFEPRAGEGAFRAVATGDIDHYLTIEIVDVATARATLAMLVESRDWYLLDEHMMRMPHGTQ